MRKKSIRAAITALVLLLCISLAGALSYYSSAVRVKTPTPAVTVEETTAGESIGADGRSQSEKYITIDEDAVPTGSGVDYSSSGNVSDGVAFTVLGVVAGVMGVAAVAAIIGVVISKHNHK